MSNVSKREIIKLAKIFRINIEKAVQNGKLNGNSFCDFPEDCCGDTSLLLAEYLLRRNIETLVVYGENSDRWTHAWLVIKDGRVTRSSREAVVIPPELHDQYGMNWRELEKERPCYLPNDLKNGLIVDITADQFDLNYPSVYVGYEDELHQDFVERYVEEYPGYLPDSLQGIYEKVVDDQL